MSSMYPHFRQFCATSRPGKRRMLGMLGVSLVTGCSFAPAYQRPPAPIAAAYPGTANVSPPIIRLGWREVFAVDPQLVALIAQALADNRDLRVATARIEAARAAYRIQGSQLYPTLDGIATGTYARTPGDLSITGRPSEAGQYQVALSAAWEIDFWGRLRNMKEAARQSFLATREAQRAVATSLVAQVAISYLAVRELDERTALAHQTIASRKESFRIARRRYEVGSGSKLDMTQSEALLTQAETEEQALQQQREQSLNAITLLVGRSMTLGSGTLTLAEADADRAIPAGLPSDLLINRPDILASEHQLVAAHADIGAARAAFFPNISLTAAGGTASSALSRLFDGGQGAWSFQPTLSLPIFNAGRNRANLDLAEARRNIAVAEYEQTIQAAFRDVGDALAQRRWQKAQIATTSHTLAALTERARLADLRYTSGRSAYLEVLDAQRDLFATQQALVMLRRGYIASGISLYAALGGGFPQDVTPEPGGGQAR